MLSRQTALTFLARRLDPAAWAGSARRLAADTRGTVAILFGFLLLPLAALTGAALDYSRASDAKTFLMAAADSAVLTAVNRTALAVDEKAARGNILAAFNAQAANMKLASGVSAKATVKDGKGGRDASISFSADVPTTLLRLIGHTTIPVAGESKASSPSPVYIDFHMLLDNSPSMGVGATPADVTLMVNNTPDQCAFACHDVSAVPNDYYSLAKKLGVTMRIDVVRTATQKLMDTAVATAVVPGQFRAAVHTLATSCGLPGPTTVSSLTSNLASVKSQSASIDLMLTPFQNFNNDQCTDFDGVFAGLNTLISNPGPGITSSNPQKVVFFVSDGVADAYYPSTCTRPTTGGRCQEPITIANCTALKDRGIKVAVLYTTYLPLPTNSWYNTWIAPFAGTIGSRMEACASPGLYFEVSPTQGISEAMTALFNKTVLQAQITR